MEEKQINHENQHTPHQRRLPEKPSKVEAQKENSNFLYGTVRETLADKEADRFADEDLNVLKHHGIYQQYDRDQRKKKGQSKADREYSCMVRCRIPGGILTAAQYLAIDEQARKFGKGSIRFTTRQAIQFHGVVVGDIKSLMRGVNDALVSTLAACGDVMRNVMCCPLKDGSPARETVAYHAEQIALQLAPQTSSYHNIWLNGEKLDEDDPILSDGQSGDGDNEFKAEPLYGKLYLPRKFKMGIALPTDNCIDVYTQDCGLIAIVDVNTNKVTGYNVLVGGGLGMTYRKDDTFARLASLIGSIEPEQAVETVRTTIEIFRDFGNREDRRHARLKYTIEEFGLEWFIEELNRRASFTLQPPVEQETLEAEDHLGWIDQSDGKWTYGLFVENGRLIDSDGINKLTGVREAVSRLRLNVRITPQQNLLLTDVKPQEKDHLLDILREHKVPLLEDISLVRRNSMACPALPTCGLALADSERVFPDIISEIEPLLDELGLSQSEIGIRMTGCPNGCARPYTADIAFVGRAPGKYGIYAGGRLAGDRLADLIVDMTTLDEIVDHLRPILIAYRDERNNGECFGDWWQRKSGRTENKQLLTGSKVPYSVMDSET